MKRIKANKLIFWVFFKYPKQISHVKHTILRYSMQGKYIQVLNLTIFDMTYLGQE